MNNEIQFNLPPPTENTKMWALRLQPSDHQKIDALVIALKQRNKTEVIRYLVRECYEQIVRKPSDATDSLQEMSTIQRKAKEAEIKRKIAELEGKALEQSKVLQKEIKKLKSEL